MTYTQTKCDKRVRELSGMACNHIDQVENASHTEWAKYLSKSIREKVQLRAKWNKERYSVMYALVGIKFRGTTLRTRLLDTQQSPLKECIKSKEV